MNKDSILSLVRQAAVAFGAFLIGKKLFGQTVDDGYLGLIAGIVVAVVGFVWGILDKSSTVEAVQAFVRQLFSFGGGLLVSAGKLTNETLEIVVGFAVPVGTWIFKLLDNRKTAQLASGKLEVVASKTTGSTPGMINNSSMAKVMKTKSTS